MASSAQFPSEYGNLKEDSPYPFSYPVDKKVSVHDVMMILRDHYGGTNYSTGVVEDVLAGGPSTTPDRFSGGAAEYSMSGSWERTIALFRSSDTYCSIKVLAW